MRVRLRNDGTTERHERGLRDPLRAKQEARVRVEFNGARIADSSRALVLHETRLPPAYYFPAEDVRMDLLARTEHTTHCPFKGNASYWSVKVGDKVAENAVWAYEEPYREAEPIRGYLSFYRDKVSLVHEGEQETG